MQVRALHRKLLRDLVRLAGPAVAIALVVATGILGYVTLRGAALSIRGARDHFYERAQFGDVFARVVRAPIAVLDRVRALPEVMQLEGRVVADVIVDVPSFPEPVRGRMLSLPGTSNTFDESPQRGLNQLALRRGRLPEVRQDEEVVVNEAFALAHRLEPESTLTVILDGHRRALRVVGVAVSPEFVYTVPAGSIWPDDARFGVLWMNHEALAAALGDQGAFNDLVIKLFPDAQPEIFCHVLDDLLERWGGARAIARKDHISDRFVSDELHQLERQTLVVPLLFLGVAAFILHMVLVRVVDSQREIVGLLKAVGYSSKQLVFHYLGFAVVVVGAGSVIGVALGAWLGSSVVDLYRAYFRFDELSFALQPSAVLTGVLFSVGAGVFGAVFAVLRVVRLAPAVAMQPPAPAAYSRGLLEKTRVLAALSPSGRMTARQLVRRPVRSALTVFGIALSMGIVVVANVMHDAVRHMMELTFLQTQREDVELSLVEARPRRAVTSAAGRLPGVQFVEPIHAVPVRLIHGPRTWDGVLEGRAVRGEASLRLPLDSRGRRLPSLPDDGIVLTDELARRLDIRPGQGLLVERLDGDRRTVDARVTALSQDLLGLHAAARLEVLDALLPEGRVASGALLFVDRASEIEIAHRLKELPTVAGVAFRRDAYATFQRTMAETYVVTRLLLAFFSSVIAVGIVYNSARIALAERARDLATLRVLGLTQREVSRIFLSEQLLLVVVALPVGAILGRGLASLLMATAASSDIFRFQVTSPPATYLFAAGVITGAAVATAWLARRRLHRLDLIGVLKARE